MIINFLGDFATNESPKDVVIGDDLEKILYNSDLNICNFEGPIDGAGQPIDKSGPNLTIHPDSPSWLKKYNFKIVTLANNHIMDYGERGFAKTIDSLKEINCIGAGSWENAYKPLILDYNGIKVALIAFTHCEFGTLTDQYDIKHSIGTAWINHDKINSNIFELKKNVDFIIALPHCGYEHLEQPLPEWKAKYKSLIDCGCDAILGSHPHIIQGYEIYKGKPIFYSLGNFFFPHNFSGKDAWTYSLCVQMKIEEGISFNAIPIHFTPEKIEVCDKKNSIHSYIKRINNILSSDQDYIAYVNNECDKLLDTYYPRLSAKRKKRLSEKILEKKGLTIHTLDNRIQDVLFLLNNYRCESHRWCIARAIKNRYGIQ